MYRKIFSAGFLGLGCYIAARYFLAKPSADGGVVERAGVMGTALQKVAPGIVDRLNTIPELERQVEQIQQQLDCCERELDESRRLNLRAAEILDMAYAQLLEPNSKVPEATSK